MDTNLSQAIKLAGGILVALVLISALVYFFSALSPLQTQLDDIKALEQTTDFNKEFEVYQKDIMYGVDVISVLNKAASYNKAYIEESGYSEDLKNNYLIDIIFEDNIELEQTIQTYRIVNNGYRVSEESFKIDDSTDNPDLKLKEDVINNHIIDSNNLDIDRGDFKNSNTEDLFTTPGIPRCLIVEEDDCINDDLYNKIIKESSKKLKVTITNRSQEEDNNPQIWSRIILQRYAYDFKTKKFRCTGINYSELTGRVVSLTFAEIK